MEREWNSGTEPDGISQRSVVEKRLGARELHRRVKDFVVRRHALNLGAARALQGATRSQAVACGTGKVSRFEPRRLF